MAEEFKGIPKADLEVLKKAARAYETLTGESVKAVGMIPVLPEESEDPAAKAKKAEETLKAEAEVTKKREESQQAERKLRIAQAKGEPGNTDEEKLEPILAPEAARQGVKPSGKKEPPNTKSPQALGAKVSS